MAAGKKAADTSKTAHVMNLLGKSRPVQTEGDAAAVPPGQPAPPAPSLLRVDTQDAAVAAEIKSALEEALEAECGAEPPKAAQAAPEDPISAAVPEPAVEEGAPRPGPEPLAQQPAAPAEEGHGTGRRAAPAYVNVMQVLVEERAENYMELFGLCLCARCRADVKALALCKLPSKYVVMGEGEMVPRITLYEQQYSAAIIAAILRACKVVLEHPHHDR